MIGTYGEGCLLCVGIQLDFADETFCTHAFLSPKDDFSHHLRLQRSPDLSAHLIHCHSFIAFFTVGAIHDSHYRPTKILRSFHAAHAIDSSSGTGMNATSHFTVTAPVARKKCNIYHHLLPGETTTVAFIGIEDQVLVPSGRAGLGGCRDHLVPEVQ